MKTKLVYVLTCAPESNYIEQALVSIYTAKHYNPDAIIVLIVDDLTDGLLTDKRSEILEYITEKKVIELNKNLPIPERSRFLKTIMREYVQGDFLYVDCDTIITSSLAEVDEFTCDLGAALDSNVPISQFHKSSYENLDRDAHLMGWNLSLEEYYFSSGVFFCKDTELSKSFFEKWHYYWSEGLNKGRGSDQPSLAMANIVMNHPIQLLDNVWNCIMYTKPDFDYESKILHFSSYKNMSYIFSNAFLEKVKTDGIQHDFIQFSILQPFKTYIPFTNRISNFRIKDYIKLLKEVYNTTKMLSKTLNPPYEPYLSESGIYGQVKWLFEKHLFFIGSLIFIMFKIHEVRLRLLNK